MQPQDESRKTMTDPYSIIPYSPEYQDELLALSQFVWTTDPRINRSYLRWKHEQNPYMEGPVFYLAIYNDRVIGMRGLTGSCWESGGVAYRIPCFGDSATIPEHRKRGIMTLITRRSMQEIESQRHPYVFGLSSGEATSKAFLNAGALTVELPVTLVMNRIQYGHDKCGMCDPYSVHDPLEIDSNIWLDRKPQAKTMSTLVKRVKRDGRIRHIRDEIYFTWRFSNPLARYWFLYCIEAGELLGYMVIQRSIKDTKRVCSIVDCEALGSNICSKLLDVALKLGIAERIQAWPMDAAQAGDFRKRGFEEDRITFRHRALVGAAKGAADGWRLGARNLADPADWDMKMVFSDNF